MLAIFVFNKGPAPISLDNRKYIFRQKKINIKKIAYVSNFVFKREREKNPLHTVVPYNCLLSYMTYSFFSTYYGNHLHEIHMHSSSHTHQYPCNVYSIMSVRSSFSLIHHVYLAGERCRFPLSVEKCLSPVHLNTSTPSLSFSFCVIYQFKFSPVKSLLIHRQYSFSKQLLAPSIFSYRPSLFPLQTPF